MARGRPIPKSAFVLCDAGLPQQQQDRVRHVSQPMTTWEAGSDEAGP
jgi:hypothetical protein